MDPSEVLTREEIRRGMELADAFITHRGDWRAWANAKKERPSMNVWFCIPAKRPLAESTLPAWRDRGYKIAIMRERADGDDVPYDLVEWVDRYHGWAPSVNFLVRWVMEKDPSAQWLVAGGDDTLPDPNFTAAEIGNQCSDFFYATAVNKAFNDAGYATPAILPSGQVVVPDNMSLLTCARLIEPIRATWGVMQPTGDRWGENDAASWAGKPKSAIIERICGSPWMGREFCRRINRGGGPLWQQYWHMFADEELHDVTEAMGILWQRRDLTHLHNHWARPRLLRSDMPAWAAEINSTTEWDRSKKLFEIRKDGGFPGHEPIPLVIQADPAQPVSIEKTHQGLAMPPLQLPCPVQTLSGEGQSIPSEEVVMGEGSGCSFRPLCKDEEVGG
jgi:hypothetical protein